MPEAQHSDRKVLLVEDDDFLAGIILKIFAAGGYRVARAKTGEAGIAEVRKEMPGLILLDLVLPEMGGFEMIANLRKDTTTKSIPFMVLSNSAESDTKRESETLGAAGYMIKAQTTPDQILSRVNDFFDAKQNAS